MLFLFCFELAPDWLGEPFGMPGSNQCSSWDARQTPYRRATTVTSTPAKHFVFTFDMWTTGFMYRIKFLR